MGTDTAVLQAPGQDPLQETDNALLMVFNTI